jgi:predicted small lipoprotein YifL
MTLDTLKKVMAVAAVALSLAACEKQGPMERAGEEVDEAIDTMKNGGEESTANKADDAVDDLRGGVNDAVDEVKD